MIPAHEQLLELTRRMKTILSEEAESTENGTTKYLISDCTDKIDEITEEINYLYSVI